uniref:long-chain-fatty-acid--CoA ligase n=1 Tax=Phallusia mammillata TaxID=59560 RepID=A0A6F9D6K2_9ASCI|nr:long-chain-fatty-acid--CoA ligase 1 [Phallusia mammillata]
MASRSRPRFQVDYLPTSSRSSSTFRLGASAGGRYIRPISVHRYILAKPGRVESCGAGLQLLLHGYCDFVRHARSCCHRTYRQTMRTSNYRGRQDPKLAVLLKGVQEGKYSIKLIVAMETIDDDNKKLADECGVKVMTFSEVEENGKANLKDFVPPKPEDLHTICYTSGTTGLPKGVMMTHRNIISNHAGVYGVGKTHFLDMGPNDVYISYLPLAHVFERLLAVQMYYLGGRVGFFQGDIKLLLSDIAELKPTVFAMVPRLINRIYDKIHAGVAGSAIKKFLLDKAHKSKLAKLRKGVVTRSSIWDSLVFKKVQNLVGGRVKFCITGAAPVSTDVLNFMRCALGIYFTEGYGQTESCCGISITVPGDYESGSVGTPVLCNHLKLVDVPEKNYFAKDGVGEICAKGANIFKGYYKDEEKTKEALDEDGWLHTGDVGKWLPNGSLKIIDRKKHIFKLSQGEYIAPEKVYFTEGYGQTEATAGIAISVPGDYYSGSVGTPTLSNYVKLVDVPEKNYFAKEGVGEICAKGPNIFQGYYKNEEKTKEALDEDGWLHTGDVGKWLPNGSLKIIDRKKHIFKQAQGEYIAPEKIEQVLVQSASSWPGICVWGKS